MNLASTVADKLDRLRAMSVADIRLLADHSHQENEKSWQCRRSVSIYVEHVDAGAVRVIVKAFESRFPHISTRAFADGFRVSGDGRFEKLTNADRTTLY